MTEFYLVENLYPLSPDPDDNYHRHASDGIDGDYRRGYQQAATALRQYIKLGAGEDAIDAWMHAIYKWRFVQSQDKYTPAPELTKIKPQIKHKRVQ